jgi:hypothetical protein
MRALGSETNEKLSRRPASATARLSADGYLHPFPIVRCQDTDERSDHERLGTRAWTLEVELDFDPTALADYWLSHSHAFLVETHAGDDVGVVDDVRLDSTTGKAVAIEVAAGWFGRRRFTLPATRVSVILPHERRLLIG